MRGACGYIVKDRPRRTPKREPVAGKTLAFGASVTQLSLLFMTYTPSKFSPNAQASHARTRQHKSPWILAFTWVEKLRVHTWGCIHFEANRRFDSSRLFLTKIYRSVYRLSRFHCLFTVSSNSVQRACGVFNCVDNGRIPIPSSHHDEAYYHMQFAMEFVMLAISDPFTIRDSVNVVVK